MITTDQLDELEASVDYFCVPVEASLNHPDWAVGPVKVLGQHSSWTFTDLTEEQATKLAALLNATPELLALARDALRFRALVNRIEKGARAVLREGADAKALCESVIIGAASACHDAEESGLGCYCSWEAADTEPHPAEKTAPANDKPMTDMSSDGSRVLGYEVADEDVAEVDIG